MIRKETRTIDNHEIHLFFDTDQQAYLVSSDLMEEFLKITQQVNQFNYAYDGELLFSLPCRPGDILYRLDKQSGDITPKKVLKIEFIFSATARDGFDWWIEFETSGACAKHNFGKTVFRNKDDAIHAFEEYQSRNET